MIPTETFSAQFLKYTAHQKKEREDLSSRPSMTLVVDSLEAKQLQRE